MKIEFYKYQGCGNDFILLDNRKNEYDNLTQTQVAFICDRHFGIGADGLMLLNLKEGYDFEMKYYNSDGAEGSMCGNGARCIVKFANSIGMHKNNYYFLASDGKHEAEIELDGIVRLKMNNVNNVEARTNHFILNTGSPHYVKHISDVALMDVRTGGKMIRNSKEFEKEGINVNFVETMEEDKIYVRTYERGVEDETLSCGTGVTASALVSAHNDNGFNRVEVKTLGGNLSVEFDKKDDEHFENIWLNGPADFVFKGEVKVPN
ncbi:MAG: diaminopimelate epimerase [Chitinophagaceae bacterium]|nr:diaminopimelate epimerase [Chitinophagaceae bacterium]